VKAADLFPPTVGASPLAKAKPGSAGVGKILALGTSVIREKKFGTTDNFSQGIPDDPARLFPVSPAPPTFEYNLHILVNSYR
jgi:hypothetical protein